MSYKLLWEQIQQIVVFSMLKGVSEASHRELVLFEQQLYRKRGRFHVNKAPLYMKQL